MYYDLDIDVEILIVRAIYSIGLSWHVRWTFVSAPLPGCCRRVLAAAASCSQSCFNLQSTRAQRCFENGPSSTDLHTYGSNELGCPFACLSHFSAFQQIQQSRRSLPSIQSNTAPLRLHSNQSSSWRSACQQMKNAKSFWISIIRAKKSLRKRKFWPWQQKLESMPTRTYLHGDDWLYNHEFSCFVSYRLLIFLISVWRIWTTVLSTMDLLKR